MVKKYVTISIVMLMMFSLLGFDSRSESHAEETSELNPYFQQQDLYISGEEGYHTFRIPSIYTTQSGTLLAFAEGRKNSASDTGNIDLVLKRSFDSGMTWEPLQVVCDAGEDTCGNPTVVQDESNGRIWLFLTQNYGEDTIEEINNGTSRGVRTIWSTYSDDDGETWTEPVNRFEEVQHPDTRWDATGPGIGIQLKHGPNKGRLVIPAIGRNIQSDDHGVTWYESGRLIADTNEPTIVELTDGTLMRNDRLSSHKELRTRAISISKDQGETWSEAYYSPELIDPIVEASIIRYMSADNEDGNQMLLFANPAHTQLRENMTVRISYDDGTTWPVEKTVYRGHSAYSSLTMLPDGKIGLLFEGGEHSPYDKIMFATFNLDWFFVEEADLDNISFSDGSISPVFRGDIMDYRLSLYSGMEEVTVTPETSDERINITINGEPAEAGVPKIVPLAGLNEIIITSTLGDRVREYKVELDRTRPNPELLLHWDFNQIQEDGITDVTGNQHTGLLKNGAEVRPGLWGDSLYLDGSQRSHVEITNEEDLHFGTENFTFSTWVNPDRLFQQRHILMWYGTPGKEVPQWWMSVEKNGAVRMNMNGLPRAREVGVATPAGLVKPGEWTHITGVRDGGNLKIYVNGELRATSVQFDAASMDVTNTDAPPLIGFDKGGPANRDWSGYMEDLRIYKYALDPSDIRKLYLNLDDRSPVTNAEVTAGNRHDGSEWYHTDVIVKLSATDNHSGVDRTEYRLNGGVWIEYAGAISISEEGVNQLEYRSRDVAGNTEEIKTKVIKIDKATPTLSVTPDKTEIWPPNNKWVPIEIEIDAKDDTSGIASIALVSITHNEGDGQNGVKEAEFGTADTTFLLQSTRNGKGNGRVYTIVYEATDAAGNKTTSTTYVTVPHDQGKH
ncbi:exo-alpha-sialidase [Lederbergia graminis]|uniref:exo-alpha-sialidase n=1 Tax=Lederbergia graminis TaxID=735518 RepID=A0ABW0LMQ1_9BACI